MIGAIFFINQKAEVVISRFYTDDVRRSDVGQFRVEVVQKKNHTAPVRRFGETDFIYIQHRNLCVVASSVSNTNVLMVYQFLYSLVRLFESYFGGIFDENSILNNFVLIYELLDEVLDFGLPQNTQPEVLKLYITQSSIKSDLAKNLTDPTSITVQATGAISWRKSNIVYKKNEVYIDVIEHVNLIVSQRGNILETDVKGEIVIRALLSGVPECRIALNDKIGIDIEKSQEQSKTSVRGILIDDCTFHQCVRLGKFETDRSITFVPPDGQFQLLSYRVTDNIEHPFKVRAIIREIGRSRIELDIKVKSTYPTTFTGQNVILTIPMPDNTAIAKLSATTGKAKYKPEDTAISWKIRKFPGNSESRLSGEVELILAPEEKIWSRAPISMEFQVPMFAASGMTVRYFRVFEKSNYTPTKWVRYITKSGTYQFKSSNE